MHCPAAPTSGPRLRLRGALIAATLTATGLACSDALSPDAAVRAPGVSSNVQALHTFQLPAPTQNDAQAQVDLNNFAERRAVRVKVEGTITSTSMAPPTQSYNVGPNGWDGCRKPAVSVVYGTTGILPIECGGTGADTRNPRESSISAVRAPRRAFTRLRH